MGFVIQIMFMYDISRDFRPRYVALAEFVLHGLQSLERYVQHCSDT